MRTTQSKTPKRKIRKQVAALPVRLDREGQLRVLLVTSRETKRFIIPKGWPMKGRKDHQAAAIEAREEAGIIGRVHKKPIGTYYYWKRRSEIFDYCKVKVYLFEFDRQLPDWRERGQRRGAWLLLPDALDLVDEPGLLTLLREIPPDLPNRLSRKVKAKAKPMSAP